MDKNTKIGILGAGLEGLEAASYFVQHGFHNITIFDEKQKDSTNFPRGVDLYAGNEAFDKAGNCEIIFRSPGIPLKKVEKIRNKGVLITSTTQYFMEHCPCPIIGVTGTKGKGTTSTLIFLMLKEAGFDVYLGGNIGQSPLTFLDKLQGKSIVVLEMSSFQLQDLTLSPHIAVVLGVTSDHLDYHKDRQEYIVAKSSIVRFQKPADLAILNFDYPDHSYFADLSKAKKLFVSTQKNIQTNKAQAGAFYEDGKLWYFLENHQKPEMIIQKENIALLGNHHLENVLPAICVAKSFKIDNSVIQKVLSNFQGLPHRLEFVAEKEGVKYYDDSISTTPETSIAAVNAFPKNPVVLLAGGSDKGADYAEWGQKMVEKPNLKAIILLGVVADRMEKALQKSGKNQHSTNLKVIRCQTFQEAVQQAHRLAKTGDVVVLSPAAASFDMFKSYKERGEQFQQLVKQM